MCLQSMNKISSHSNILIKADMQHCIDNLQKIDSVTLWQWRYHTIAIQAKELVFTHTHNIFCEDRKGCFPSTWYHLLYILPRWLTSEEWKWSTPSLFIGAVYILNSFLANLEQQMSGRYSWPIWQIMIDRRVDSLRYIAFVFPFLVCL